MYGMISSLYQDDGNPSQAVLRGSFGLTLLGSERNVLLLKNNSSQLKGSLSFAHRKKGNLKKSKKSKKNCISSFIL